MTSHLHRSIVMLLLAGIVAGACTPTAPVDHAQTPTPATQPVEKAPTPVPTEQHVDNDQEVKIVLKSDKPQIVNPEVPAADMLALGSGNRAFALRLYQNLSGQDGNLFFSPYSISLALAMVYAAARNNTESQMAQALHFDLPQSGLHPAFNALGQDLESRAKTVDNGQDGGLVLNIANSLWGQAGYSFQNEYLDTLAENYDAALHELDFSQSEQARETINNWVAEQTNDRTMDLIQPGSLSSLTRLVLTNAVYFNAAWQFPFDPQLSSKGNFTLLDGSTIEPVMMQRTNFYGYTSGKGYQALKLPYAGNTASMILILPESGKFVEFEKSLDASKIETVLTDLQENLVRVTLPKFKVESSFSLNESLEALGMIDAFAQDKADFSGMTGKPDLFISEIAHKAFVVVDEEGTEAAAATEVRLAGMGDPQPVDFTVDSPFIFLIVDRESGTILFIGRVLDPR